MGIFLRFKSKTKNLSNLIFRKLNNLGRPSKKNNLNLLKARDETMNSFLFRQVRREDLAALARLHVRTWNDTYPNYKNPPTLDLRERQWMEQFDIVDGSWFCIIIETTKKELIGFAKGKINKDGTGDLDKIYLLAEYQRLGLGRKLVGHVVSQFIENGMHRMVLFGIPQNPSCSFHEALGGEKLFAPNGEFRGGYSWSDLPKLASICPIG